MQKRLETRVIKNINRTDAVTSFLKKIANYKVMDRKEEREALERFKNGDIKAKQELMESNQRFVFSVAKNYGNGDKLMDLVSEGNLGLSEAIDNFDITKDVKFISHAVWYIRRRMNAFIMNDDMLIKKTNRTVTSYKVNKFKNTFFAENGRMPSDVETIDMLNQKYDLKVKYEDDIFDLRLDSISTSYDDSDKTCFENSPLFQSKTIENNNYIDDINDDFNKEQVSFLMRCLTSKEKDIIARCFGIGYDYKYELDDIALEYNISEERVRQIKKFALKKMFNLYNKSLKKQY